MTTPYVLSEGEFVAVVPSRGPCWKDGEPCAIGLHHRRLRKSGLPFGWVAVMRCSKHQLAFTAYPAGHIPYGREPLVALAPDGTELDEGASRHAQAAIADLAEGRSWPRVGAMETDGVRSTQTRRVHEVAGLLGLAVGSGVTPAIAAAILGVPEGGLGETARGLASARDVVIWGRAVGNLWATLARRGGRWLMDRFALLGYLAGWWGTPWRWLMRPARLLGLGQRFWPGTRGRWPP